MGKTGGITTDADGHLYLSSDHGAAIYRISHSPLIGSWEHTLPDAIVERGALDFEALVTVERLAALRHAQLPADW